MIPSNLIINADDFGLDPFISDGIFYCIRHGLINSISVLPFRDAYHKDLLRRIVSEYPGIRVGCHLSLIETMPLLESTPRYSERQAAPANYTEFLRMWMSGGINIRQIEMEWNAQAELLKAYLGKDRHLDHLDSHQHLHVLPRLWGLVQNLKEANGISRIRVPFESLGKSIFYKFPAGFFFQLLSRYRLGGTDPAFLGFFTSTRFSVKGNLAGLGQVMANPSKTFELMVHPGYRPKIAGKLGKHKLLEGAIHESELEIEELKLLYFFFSGETDP